MRRSWFAISWGNTVLDPLQIIQEVSENTGVSSLDILSKSRRRKIVWARQFAQLRIRRETRLTFETIGGLFGQHHSTVSHGIRAIDDVLWRVRIVIKLGLSPKEIL